MAGSSKFQLELNRLHFYSNSHPRQAAAVGRPKAAQTNSAQFLFSRWQRKEAKGEEKNMQ
jgi:hypothetical protein